MSPTLVQGWVKRVGVVPVPRGILSSAPPRSLVSGLWRTPLGGNAVFFRGKPEGSGGRNSVPFGSPVSGLISL